MRLFNVMFFFVVPVLLRAQAPTNGVAIAAAVDERADRHETSPSQQGAFTPLSAEQKAAWRVKRLVGPVSLASWALGAGIEQWRNDPKPWDRGIEGYARRLGSAAGYDASDAMIGLGVDIAFGLDPRYRRKPDARFGGHLWNAVSQTIFAYKDSGGRMINVSEIGGTFGAGFVANTWEPHGYNSAGDALIRGASGIAYHTAKNVVREFLPGLSLTRKH